MVTRSDGSGCPTPLKSKSERTKQTAHRKGILARSTRSACATVYRRIVLGAYAAERNSSSRGGVRTSCVKRPAPAKRRRVSNQPPRVHCREPHVSGLVRTTFRRFLLNPLRREPRHAECSNNEEISGCACALRGAFQSAEAAGSSRALPHRGARRHFP